MPLFGLVSALIACVIADLRGNDTTRPFTRRAFAAVVAVEMGLNLTFATSVFASIGGAL